MKLVIGLGNFGMQYAGTRHNTGFTILDSIAEQQGLHWTPRDKYKAEVAQGIINGQKMLLAKPTTFYNASGEAARALKDFYKAENTDILIIHDELDLPFGTVRARGGGSDAGNNGIKSIVAHIGADVPRLRIGIANQHLAAIDSADFVLSRFTKQEAEQWPRIIHEAAQFVIQFIDPNQKFEHASVRIS